MKKILSLLLIFIFALNCMPAFAEEVTAEAVTNINVEKTEDARRLLTAIGVIPSFSPELTDGVTRADFINAVMAAFDFGLYDNARENCFYDVSESDYFCSAVNYALDMGIISAGLYFRPNDYITYSEAAKIITVSLGYELNAQINGGYPAGYIYAANRLDLDKWITVNPTDALNTSQAYIILANMLESDIHLASAVLNHKGDYSIKYNEDSNILTLFYDWYHIEGVVTGNHITQLYDKSGTLANGCIMVGLDRYYCAQSPVLGAYIKGYAKKDGVSDTIQYYTTMSEDVAELLPKNEPVLSGTSVEYINDNGKNAKYKLESIFTVVYNGKVCYDFDEKDFEIKIGKIILVDSDRDSSYDVVHIYNGEIIVPDIVNTSTSKVVDSYKGITLNLSDDESYYVYEGGILGNKGVISANSALEYYPSKSRDYFIINVLTDSVFGKLTATSADAVYIDDKEYKYADYFKERYLPTVSMGASNTFICTADGTVAALVTDADATTTKLAYAYRYGISDDIDKKVEMKVLNRDGSHALLELADKVRVNGSVSMEPADIFNMYLANTDGVVLRYRTNSDGVVNTLYFPEDAAPTTAESIYDPTCESREIIKPYVIKGIEPDTQINYHTFGLLVNVCSIDSNTVIFCAEPNEDLEDERRYTISTYGDWQNNSKFTFGGLTPYNVKPSGLAEILLVKSVTSDNLDADGVSGGVIESVTQALDNRGELALKIVLCNRNEYETLFLPQSHEKYAEAANPENINSIGIGDYIVYTKDIFNNIIAFERHFDYSTGKLEHSKTSGDIDDVFVYAYGTLDAFEAQSFSVDVESASTGEISGKINLVMQWNYSTIVDIKHKTVSSTTRSAAADYMKQGYKVLLRIRYGDVTELIVYKNE